MADRPIAFVPTRFGTDVVGGSESVMREAALGLADRGWTVDVLTTCARDHYTWANEYPAGLTEIGGVRLHRFPTRHGSPAVRAELEGRLHAGGGLSPTDERRWLDAGFLVPDLVDHLRRHGDGYGAVVFSPYLFWTSIAGAEVVRERSVVMPCLHDEPYARLGLVRPLLGDAAAVWFLSEPEHFLAHRLGAVAPRHTTTGAGVPVPDRYDPDGFRARHGIDGPFVLYAGRREGGKGWDDLTRSFARAVTEHGVDLRLVTMGVGTASAPASVRDRVVDLGFVADELAPDAFAAASAYVQPSRNESFSRTIMESWLAGTMVLANVESDVVTWHCDRSRAGLTYRGDDELVALLAEVAADPAAAGTIAEPGREYVLEHYRWPVVLDAMETGLREVIAGEHDARLAMAQRVRRSVGPTPAVGDHDAPPPPGPAVPTWRRRLARVPGVRAAVHAARRARAAMRSRA